MKRKWPTLEGRLNHPLTSKREALEQMKKNGDVLTEQALEYIEKCLEEDVHWQKIRKKVQNAIDNSPKCVSLEQALEQVKSFRK